MGAPKSLKIFAPAKINLFLHVTGRRDDGYHLLDSLVAFADIGDTLHITSATDFSLKIDGPYADAFDAKEKDSSPHSSNLVARAAWNLARVAQKTLNTEIRLTKNLPLGAGLGGGSSDAAAVIWGLCEYWGLAQTPPDLKSLLLSLGADVPVCHDARTARLQGIGEIITPLGLFPEIPVVLIYPGHPCETKSVFAHFHAEHQKHVTMPEQFENFETVIDFLYQTKNDLYEAACNHVPAITECIFALNAQKNCALARMSGSGSSCFGLFKNEKDALIAAQTIQKHHPHWWVKTGWLGRPERY